MNPPIILASSSPYRRELLAKLGMEFKWQSPDIDENPRSGESPEALVARLAEEKARAIAREHGNALIIASDQVAVLNGQILGKPGDHANGVKQLSAASGHEVRFLTSLALLNSGSGRIQLEVVPFTVHFRPLTASEIENYLHKEQPYHCAGAFKSEGLGIALFERLEGDDPNTLIGLPLIRLVRMLKHEGVTVI
jgi:MAF protein